MSLSIDLSSKKIDDLFRKAYTHFADQDYSFDELAETFDEINGRNRNRNRSNRNRSNRSKPRKVPLKYRHIIQDEDRALVKKCLLYSLQKLFDDKPYDEDASVLSDIDDYKKDKKEGYQYYPDPKEHDFIEQLSMKQEMRLTYVSNERKTSDDKCNRGFFELAPHQIFLKNLISRNTGYDGILIFHGVGVGKTCSGVSIAENFKDSYKHKDKRIIILASQNIQIGWKSTIYDPEKGDNQCTNNTYELQGASDGVPVSSIETAAKKQIRDYYELHGYAAFANSVKKMLRQKLRNVTDESERESLTRDLIDSQYSGRVLIIDEVHNIRTGSDKEVRDTIYHIELVIKYSKDLKLVLLTANPMFNQSDEIIWILNMLLLNDGRPIIQLKDVFEDHVATPKGREILAQKCQGYVSYLRGENPVSFPVRLYPEKVEVDEDDRKHLTNRENSPKIDIFGSKIDEKERLDFLELYSSSLRGVQRDCYLSQVDEYEGKELNTLQNQVEHQLLQITNIVYPMASVDDVKGMYGEEGLDRCFRKTTKSSKTTYRYRQSTLDAVEGGEFLDEDKIGEYSAKIKSILECIRSSDGIVFIYSNWIKSGVIPMILALEQNGYQKYDKQDILTHKRKKEPISYDGTPYSKVKGTGKSKGFKRASYMVIAGGQENLSNDLANELRIVASSENKDGSLIKVVIGSKVASEGLDFKCVRSIHVMEPWHNINRLEQVIGRGVRNCSHKDLNPSQRNATIYLHNAYLDQEKETIDTYLYRYSEKKAKQIGDIETILKANAVDKYLFQNMNHLTKQDVDSFEVQPAFRKTIPQGYTGRPRQLPTSRRRAYLFTPEDRPFTRVCSFQPKCEYMEDKPMEEGPRNTDTFVIDYSQGSIDTYKKRIALLLREHGSIEVTGIKAMIEEYQEVHDIFLSNAIDQCLSERYPILSSQGIMGYPIINDGHLLFQPSFSTDELIPYYYRYTKGCFRSKDPILKPLEVRKTIVDTSDTVYDIGSQNTMISELRDYSLTEIEQRICDIFKFKGASRSSYIIDRMQFSDRLVIMSIACALASDKPQSDYGHEETGYGEYLDNILDYGARLFIYYDEPNDRFSYSKDSERVQLYGFILYHSRNKKLYSYRYVRDGNIVSQTNAIDQIQIEQQLGPDPRTTYKHDSWGFMIFSERYRKNQNGIVCKVVDRADKLRRSYHYPPGPGAIIRDTNKNDNRILSTNPLQFIRKEFKDYMDRGGDNAKDYLEKDESQSKMKCSVLIELCLREKGRILPQELVYLKYL